MFWYVIWVFGISDSPIACAVGIWWNKVAKSSKGVCVVWGI